MAKKRKALHKTFDEIFKKPRRSRTPKKEEIPEVFLTALKRWERGYVQLKRNAIREIFNLKSYWGYFIMICVLADYKTSTLKTRSLTLSRMFGLTRKYVYRVLKILNELKYINYQPAKNQYQSEINITIPKYKSYIKIKDDEDVKSGRVKKTPPTSYGGVKKTPPTSYGGVKKTPLNFTNPFISMTSEPLKTLNTIKDIIKKDDDEILRLFKEKTNQEISSDVIRKLLQKSDQNVILKHIKRLNWDPGIENPIGLLIDSLENPQNYPSLEKESQGEREERERLQREKEEKEKQEELKRIEEERKKSEQLEGRFNQLSQKKRDSYVKRAEEELRKESPNLTEETLQEIILRPHNIKIRAIEVMKREEEIKI